MEGSHDNTDGGVLNPLQHLDMFLLALEPDWGTIGEDGDAYHIVCLAPVAMV
jgi:hypothetical protein